MVRIRPHRNRYIRPHRNRYIRPHRNRYIRPHRNRYIRPHRKRHETTHKPAEKPLEVWCIIGSVYIERISTKKWKILKKRWQCLPGTTLLSTLKYTPNWKTINTTFLSASKQEEGNHTCVCDMYIDALILSTKSIHLFAQSLLFPSICRSAHSLLITALAWQRHLRKKINGDLARVEHFSRTKTDPILALSKQHERK